MPRSRFHQLAPALGLWAFAALSHADEPRLLQPGAPVERAILAGEAHVYRVAAGSERLRLLSVRPFGIDVDVAVGDREGHPLTRVGSPGGRYGVETLVMTRSAATVEIRTRPHRSPGSYRILLTELPAITDPRRLLAERAMTRAGELYLEADPATRRKAVTAYLEALELWRTLGDRAREARTLFNLGSLHNELGEMVDARGFLEQSLPIWPATARASVAATLNQIGLTHARESDGARAVEVYRQALVARRQLGDVYGEALTLSNIGQAYNGLGTPRSALEPFESALDLARRAGDTHLVARILNNLGGSYRYLGEIHDAASYFRRALDQQRVMGDRQLEAVALLNLGAALRGLGEYHEALRHYQEALAIWRQQGNPRREATTLNSLGFVYLNLGEARRALAYFEQALPLRRDAGDRRGEASTLHNLGWAFHRLERPDKARDLYLQALRLRRELGDRPGEAASLDRLAQVEAEHGDPARALKSYELALSLRREVGNRRQEAHILSRIGKLHLDLREPRRALEHLLPALRLHRDVEDVAGEATALAAIGRAEHLEGDLASARRHLETALDLIERQRARIPTPDLRASFLADQRAAYQATVDVLMSLHREAPDAGYDGVALFTNERAHARGLLDLLWEAGAEAAQATDPELAKRRQRLLRLLNLKAQRRSRLLAGQLADDEEGVERDLTAILTELDLVEGQIRRRSPRYADLIRPEIATPARIRRLLDADTLLLEYALGASQSFLWAITADSVTSFELPARDEIETAGRRLYEAWSRLDPREGPSQDRKAAELSDLILAPVAARLAGQRLVVVADGVLHYIPFAALPDPARDRQPLLRRHEVVQLPSASVLAARRRLLKDRTPAPGAVAILADPVFDAGDPRLTARTTDSSIGDSDTGARARRGMPPSAFARLPMTRREARTITDLSLSGEVLVGLDFQASRALATSGALSRFRIVHFATHGVLDSRHPELSGLVLSQVDAAGRKIQGFLDLHDIYNLRLTADLVILSGCQTALGKQIRGEGLVGLTRGFMYAGAPRVLASLWRIQDKATAELMAAFYRALLVDELAPAAALRVAQLAVREELGWRDPYYWAPFILQGDWRQPEKKDG